MGDASRRIWLQNWTLTEVVKVLNFKVPNSRLSRIFFAVFDYIWHFFFLHYGKSGSKYLAFYHFLLEYRRTIFIFSWKILTKTTISTESTLQHFHNRLPEILGMIQNEPRTNPNSQNSSGSLFPYNAA